MRQAATVHRYRRKRRASVRVSPRQPPLRRHRRNRPRPRQPHHGHGAHRYHRRLRTMRCPPDLDRRLRNAARRVAQRRRVRTTRAWCRGRRRSAPHRHRRSMPPSTRTRSHGALANRWLLCATPRWSPGRGLRLASRRHRRFHPTSRATPCASPRRLAAVGNRRPDRARQPRRRLRQKARASTRHRRRRQCPGRWRRRHRRQRDPDTLPSDRHRWQRCRPLPNRVRKPCRCRHHDRRRT